MLDKFDSFGDMLAYANANPNKQQSDKGDKSFCETANYAEAHKLAVEGWHAVRPEVGRIMGQLSEQIDSRVCTRARSAKESLPIRAIYRYGNSPTNVARAIKAYERLADKAQKYAARIEKACDYSKAKAASTLAGVSGSASAEATQLEAVESASLFSTTQSLKRRLAEVN